VSTRGGGSGARSGANGFVAAEGEDDAEVSGNRDGVDVVVVVAEVRALSNARDCSDGIVGKDNALMDFTDCIFGRDLRERFVLWSEGVVVDTLAFSVVTSTAARTSCALSCAIFCGINTHTHIREKEKNRKCSSDNERTKCE